MYRFKLTPLLKLAPILLTLTILGSSCFLLQKKVPEPILGEYEHYYLIYTGDSKPVGWAYRQFKEVQREVYVGYRYFFEMSFQFQQANGRPMLGEVKEEQIMDEGYRLREFRFLSKLNQEVRTTEGYLTERNIKVRLNWERGLEIPMEDYPFSKVYGDYIMHHPAVYKRESIRFKYFDVNKLVIETRIISFLETVSYQDRDAVRLLKKFVVEDKNQRDVYFYYLDENNNLFTTNLLGDELLLKKQGYHDVLKWFEDFPHGPLR
jgi:hypothetical protein